MNSEINQWKEEERRLTATLRHGKRIEVFGAAVTIYAAGVDSGVAARCGTTKEILFFTVVTGIGASVTAMTDKARRDVKKDLNSLQSKKQNDCSDKRGN